MSKTVADQESTSELTFTIKSHNDKEISLDIGSWPCLTYSNESIANIIIALNEAMYGDPKKDRMVLDYMLSGVRWRIRRCDDRAKIRIADKSEYYLSRTGVDQVTKWLLEALSDPR